MQVFNIQKSSDRNNSICSDREQEMRAASGQIANRRRPRSRHSSLLKVSTMALSMSSVVAFQNCKTPLARVAHVGRLNYRRPTSQQVVTDPDYLLSMKVDERKLEALEDMYLLTSESDGLSGDLVEIAPGVQDQVQAGKNVRPRNHRPSTRHGEKPRNKSSSPPSLLSPQPKNSLSGRVLSRAKPSRTPRSRSSTMPGFSGSRITGRQQAFRDGIKLVEARSGKKFVDNPEAKRRRRQINGEAMYKSSASVPDSMIQFANEIHDVERITPAEETELGMKTQEAIRLQSLYDDLEKKLDRPPTDGEWCAAAGKINMEAITQAIEDGLEAKNKLVTSNLRMVQGVVNVYIRNGLGGQYNAGDLMQEGIMALIRAAEKFDPGRGFRFSTYAMYWIRSSIKRSQIYQSRVVTVPQRLYENHKRIVRVERELKQSLERAPSKAEIGEAIGMSEAQIDRCLTAMSQRCYSLDQHVINTKKPMNGDTREDTMYELVESRTDDGEYNKLKQIFFREDLIKTITRHLTEEEANLLLLRYGLTGSSKASSVKAGGPLTIAEVSRHVGLKPDKVRRMINKSLKHLKAIIGSEWVEYERDLQ